MKSEWKDSSKQVLSLRNHNCFPEMETSTTRTNIRWTLRYLGKITLNNRANLHSISSIFLQKVFVVLFTHIRIIQSLSYSSIMLCMLLRILQSLSYSLIICSACFSGSFNLSATALLCSACFSGSFNLSATAVLCLARLSGSLTLFVKSRN